MSSEPENSIVTVPDSASRKAKYSRSYNWIESEDEWRQLQAEDKQWLATVLNTTVDTLDFVIE